MCKCIENTTQLASKKLVTEVEKGSTVSEWINKGSFENKGLSLSGGPSKISMPFIIKYIRKKVNGEPEKRETTAHTYIYLSFCPFCGEKYN
jgi:hypothetical protein